MDGLQHVPAIIEQAAKNPLGVAALIVLVCGFLGYVYFREASQLTRMLMFALMGLGALMLAAMVLSPQPTYVAPPTIWVPQPAEPARTLPPPPVVPPSNSPRYVGPLCHSAYGACVPAWTDGVNCKCDFGGGRISTGLMGAR